MIFSGSSALDLEYNPDASRRIDKERINPLNYGEHLRLKYNIKLEGMSESLQKLIFEGNMGDAVKREGEMRSELINMLDYPSNDWDIYLKYGGFPILFTK